ncbi:MAG: alpha/beta fold hydrolase [Trueperaceae bacterium]|nr:MAG: alpha/beta fold hydrolase [Trueperaceae bacterium]
MREHTRRRRSHCRSAAPRYVDRPRRRPDGAHASRDDPPLSPPCTGGTVRGRRTTMHIESPRPSNHVALGSPSRAATGAAGCERRTRGARRATVKRLRVGAIAALSFAIGLFPLGIAVAQDQSGVAEPTALEVTFTSGDITLAGTLTLPGGAGRHPALVTITGSGPQDRDNAHPSIPGYRPFAWLAEHLMEHGMAVLRFDERGVGESEGAFEGATSADFARDVEAAVAYLREHPDIDPSNVGLVGHSEGSMIAGMIAARDPDLAFVVSLAGASVDGFTLMRNQIANLAFSQAPSEEFAELIVRSEIRAMELTVAEEWESLEEHLVETYRTQFEMLPADQAPPADQIEPLARQTAEQELEARYQDPWFRYFLTYDPGQDWERVTIPVLAVYGEHDLQVDADFNREPLAEALDRAGNTDATIVTLERSNHLFLETETGDVMEYADLEMAFAPGFLDLVTDWLSANVAE